MGRHLLRAHTPRYRIRYQNHYLAPSFRDHDRVHLRLSQDGLRNEALKSQKVPSSAHHLFPEQLQDQTFLRVSEALGGYERLE